MPISRSIAFLLTLAFSSAAIAHEASHAAKHSRAISSKEHAFGREGKTNKVSRTVVVNMSDTMRFSPAELQVKRGETIRFEISNSGKTMHEMVLGTMKELKDHAEHMRKHAGMQHDEPYMIHVQPGKKETLVWEFTKPGEFYYACLVPGHFEAGMVGRITVAAAK